MYGELLSFCSVFLRNKYYEKLKIRLNTGQCRILFLCLNDEGKGTRKQEEEKPWLASQNIICASSPMRKQRPQEAGPQGTPERLEDVELQARSVARPA